MDVGQNTTLGDGDMTQKLVQLLVISDGKLEMTGNDTGLLVVARSVTSQLENFGSKVLKNSGKVDGGTGTNTLSVVALAQETVNTANGEGQTSLGRTTKSNCEQKRNECKVQSPVHTTERSWSQRPCHQICHRRSF